MTPIRNFFRLSCVILLGSFLLSSCQVRIGKKKDKDDAETFVANAGNENWKKNYQEAQAKHATKPGWNQAPSIPRANMGAARTSYSSVKISEPYIALTFDDGPHPSNTPRLLDILKARNVKVTFFVVGTNSKAYPSILRRMVAEGHEVANHTWTHGDMTKVSRTRVKKELDDSRDAIVKATGVPPRVWRPPYGAANSDLKSWIKSEYGYPTIMWSVDPMDWKRPGVSVVADRLVAGARNGGILLLHDIHKPTIDATPKAVDRLLSKGFKFVTVSQLIELEQRAKGGSAPKPSAPAAKPIGG